MPNGLQAYLLVNGKGERIDTGPIEIVSNKENANDPVVRNGLTCMSCHAQGMKRFSDNMRAVLAATPKGQTDFDRDHALALYIEKPKMDDALNEDTKRFANAVRETGAEVTTREPIYALQGRYDFTVDIAQAAGEAGLPTETFQSKLQANARLGTLIGPLKTSGGRLKRDAWEEYFGDVVQELHLGLYVKATVQPLANAIAAVQPPVNLIPGGKADNIAPAKANPLPAEPKEPGAVAVNGRNPNLGGNHVPGRNLGNARQIPDLNAEYGMELMEIPAGMFTMGSAEADIYQLPQFKSCAGEMPQHKIYLDTYYIAKNVVTVKQYFAFCTATGHLKPPEPSWGWKEDHPIVNVTWNDAHEYCGWLSHETGLQVSLPTEAEWEKAARGTEGQKYPWGNDWDSSKYQHSTRYYGDAGSTGCSWESFVRCESLRSVGHGRQCVAVVFGLVR